LCIQQIKPVYNAESNPDRADKKEIPIEKITELLAVRHQLTNKDIEKRYMNLCSYYMLFRELSGL